MTSSSRRWPIASSPSCCSRWSGASSAGRCGGASERRLFDRLQIRYRAIDLDSVEYQQDDRGGRIRAALAARTSVVTIPQIFIGGEFIGGCTDLFEAWRGGRAQDLLERSGVDYDRTAKIDPYTFLPGWLHPR